VRRREVYELNESIRWVMPASILPRRRTASVPTIAAAPKRLSAGPSVRRRQAVRAVTVLTGHRPGAGALRRLAVLVQLIVPGSSGRIEFPTWIPLIARPIAVPLPCGRRPVRVPLIERGSLTRLVLHHLLLPAAVVIARRRAILLLRRHGVV